MTNSRASMTHHSTASSHSMDRSMEGRSMSGRSMSVVSNNNMSMSQILPNSSRKRQVQARLSDFFMERLHRSPLVGRDEELATLKEAVKMTCSRQPKEAEEQAVDATTTADTSATTTSARHLVCVAGHSGTGKTSLVQKAMELGRSQYGAFCITGKFDSLQRDEPLGGLQPALLSLCHQMAEHEQHSDLRTLLKRELGSEELALLLPIMPNLVNVIGTDDNKDKDDNVGNPFHEEPIPSESMSHKERADRLKFILRRFVQIVTDYRPIVLHCDDVQWADQASLTLMTSLLTDTDISNLLVLASYRDENDEDIQPFLTTVRGALGEMSSSRSIQLTDLTIGPLTERAVDEMVANILSHDPQSPETIALAQLVLKRTGGNAFYIHEFVSRLAMDNLITYHTGNMVWTWDVETVRTRSLATENVVENMLKERIQETSQNNTGVLLIAACLGRTFSETLLATIVKGFCESEHQAKAYEEVFGRPPAPQEEEALDELILGQLIEQVGGPMHTFIHDKIQEAALELISAEALARIRYSIGSILFENLPEDQLTEHSFMVAEFLQAVPELLPTKVEDRIRIVSLNQIAGSNAIQKSAFVPALAFYRNAISLLPVDHWETMHELSLDLYSSATECAYAIGDAETTREYGMLVMDSEMPILQKMRVAYVMMDLLVAESSKNREIDCTSLGLDVLKQLGCPFPKSNFGLQVKTIMGLLRLKKLGKKQIEVEKLPRSNCPRDLAVMKTLDKLVTATFIARPELMPLCIVKNVSWTLKRGATEYSAPALSWAGFILGNFMGAWDPADSFGHAALALTDHLNVRASVSRNNLIAYVYIFHFRLSYDKCIDPLLKGYELGLATGDVDSAMWSIFFYIHFQWLTGASVDMLHRDAVSYSKMMKDFGQLQQYSGLTYWWQLFENLLNGPETSLFKGTAFNEQEKVPVMIETGDLCQLAAFHVPKMTACAFFGEFKEGAELAINYGDAVLKNVPGQPAIASFLYMAGLCCYAEAKESGKAKFYRYANKCRKTLKDWLKKGGVNNFHLESLLDAEYERYRGNHFPCLKHYETGILLSGRLGLTHYQALGNERFASHWKSRGNSGEDAHEAQYRLNKALDLYKEWGAAHKVEQMRFSHEDLKIPSQIGVVVQTPSCALLLEKEPSHSAVGLQQSMSDESQ